MRSPVVARPVLMLLRLTGVLALLLGAVVWLGAASSLVSLHMAVGIVFVICLWILAILGLIRGGQMAASLAAALMGFVVLGVGLGQASWLPGPNHWLVQVVHLVVGVAAIGVGEMVGAARRARALA